MLRTLTVSEAACVRPAQHVVDLGLHHRGECILLRGFSPKDFVEAIYNLMMLSRLGVTDFDLIRAVCM